MQLRAEGIGESQILFLFSMSNEKFWLKQVDEETNPQRADFQSQIAKYAHLLVDVQINYILFIVPLQKLVMHVWSR